ncbi:MAG: helix-turn-helix domain-containing protein [Candidatus Marinimicrobia bacterium]|nr:helix-turn-helix domain-containing protein [Candidatus Neomarinimicrobiota bacterium]
MSSTVESKSNISPWFSIKETCAYLNIGKTKLRQLINDGRLKHYRLGGQIRIHQRDCDSLLIFQKSFNKLTRPQKQTVEDIHG